MMLRIFDAFFLQNCICWILFGTLTINFDILDEIIVKIIESRYIGICPIIDKIIDIDRRLPQIIGDFRELSAKLSISKMAGKLSKIYRYRKKWLIAHPYPLMDQMPNFFRKLILMAPLITEQSKGPKKSNQSLLPSRLCKFFVHCHCHRPCPHSMLSSWSVKPSKFWVKVDYLKVFDNQN